MKNEVIDGRKYFQSKRIRSIPLLSVLSPDRTGVTVICVSP